MTELTSTSSSPLVQPAFIAGCLAGSRILLAEDAPDNQILMRRILGAHGALVDIAANGAIALELAAKASYDLILMDIQMPVLDGYEATARLRQEGFRRPIIAVTAHALAEERERAFQAGCDEHLVKPINVQRLLRLVSLYLGRVAPQR